MRVSRALAVTATAFAAVGLSAPMAAATNGPVNVAVNPQAVHQGGTLKITAQGCGHGGKVWSNAFPTTTLSPGDGTNFAHARVRNNTTPGQYHLSVKCSDNDRIATHKFTVLIGNGAQGGLGGSMGPSSVEMQVGGGLVAAAAVGGAVFLVRQPADRPCGVLRHRTSRPARYARRPESWIRTRGDCRAPHARVSVAAVGGAAAREVEGARGRRGHQSRSGGHLHGVGGAGASAEAAAHAARDEGRRAGGRHRGGCRGGGARGAAGDRQVDVP